MLALTSLFFLYRGIYVPDESRWPEKFRGMGIRIEDSVCVGDDDPITLTPEAVKEVRPSNPVSDCISLTSVHDKIDDIEALRS